MSNNNAPELSRSNGDEHNKEQKVIVLSIKDMPSFKMKDFLGTQESGHSVFNFKPQQLLQTTTGSSATTSMQVTQPKNVPIATSTPVQKLITNQAGSQFVIRRQQQAPPRPTTPKPYHLLKQPQQILSLVVTPGGIKIQDPPKLVTSQVSNNKLPNPFQSVKAIPSAVQAPSSVTKKAAPHIFYNQQQKTFQVISPKPTLQAHPQFQNSRVFNKDIRPIPILPKPNNNVQQKMIPYVQQVVLSQRRPAPQVPQTAASGKSIVYSTTSSSVPALTPIQSKVIGPITILQSTLIKKSTVENKKIETEEAENQDLEESMDEGDEEQNFEDEFDESEIEIKEKEEITSHKAVDDEEYLNVKRIIEGDEELNNYVVTQNTSSNNIINNNNDVADNSTESVEEKEVDQEEEEEVEKDKNYESESKSEICEQQSALSDSLLCDEQIATISPEQSPESNDKSKDTCSITPKQNSSADKASIDAKSMADVKRTLNLDLELVHGKDEKISLKIEIEEENDSVISDDTNVSSVLQKTTIDNDDDSLQSKSEIGSESKNPKRSRKTKHPTVNSNLGLPYKPPQTAANNRTSRRKKSEKKIELEHDFHDPLNKIQWDEGIGGLNNCNKLFGFNDYGLVEVINKKDAKAKLNRSEDKNIEENSSFKFKKILNPADHFGCVVCSKIGTIRDFYSPECCSEACLAITKRKAFEYGDNRDHDSGQSSPTSDAHKVFYGGEMVSLQKLQTFLMKQKLPGKNRQQTSLIKPFPNASDDRFSWSTYLSPKSVPAPPDFFSNNFQSTPNPFKVGMKIEAIDPENQKLFCVCTVEERLGHRIKLHFDGYPSNFDFWVDAHSKSIFPIDFCRSTKRSLQLPPKWLRKVFDWSEYLDDQNCVGAQRNMFSHLEENTLEKCSLEIGMKLEVYRDDFWYAGTISDILFDRMLIVFDEPYEKIKCAWYNFNSSFLSPCNSHKTLDDPYAFLPPCQTIENFKWEKYLKGTDSKAVPVEFFKSRKCAQNKFEPGMKLEVVDKINPQLIRPATVLSRDDFKIQVNFDGFDISYAFWLNFDSEDIYPINYCKETAHPIEYPAGYNQNDDFILCSTAGCRGIGNGIHSDCYFHENDDECPYSMKNWKQLINATLPSRFDWKQPTKKSSKPQRVENCVIEKRPSSARFKKYVNAEINLENFEMDISEDIQEPLTENKPMTKSEPSKRGRKRKIQPVTTSAEVAEESDAPSDAKIRVVEQFLHNYGPKLNYTFNLWTENSKVLDKAVVVDELSENPLTWSVDEVCTYIVKFCNEETTAKFYAQMIDGEALLSLCQKDLVDLMDIKVGPAIKIYNRILHLRQEVVTKFLKI